MREDIFRDYCRKLEAEDEEEMAKKEDERRQRDRKARYDFIDLNLSVFKSKFCHFQNFFFSKGIIYCYFKRGGKLKKSGGSS